MLFLVLNSTSNYSPFKRLQSLTMKRSQLHLLMVSAVVTLIFDPEYDYLDEPLIAYRLEQGRYLELAIKDHRVMSDALGLS